MHGGFGPNDSLDLLLNNGEMGHYIRAHNWAATPLGQPEGWPQALKTLVGVMVSSKQPMFIAWSPERTLLYNDAYAEILARKHPAALGRPILEVWSEIRDDLLPLVQQACAGDPVHLDDISFILKRRGYPEEAHFSFSYTPVRDETGAVAGFFCACTETTRQVIAERQLASETERQRRQFEQAPGFIAILRGPEHMFEFTNQAYQRLVGNRDCIGRSAREVFPELEDQGFFEHLDRVYATGERFVAHDVPVRLQRSPSTGPEERFLSFVYEPVFDAVGRVTGIFCEGHDVTDAHLAQGALAASEERLRRVLETDAVGVLFFDYSGRLIDANDVFLTMTGWSREDIESGSLDWRRMTPPEWVADSEAQMETLMRTGRLGPYEKEYLRNDGSRSWMLFAGRDLGDGTIVEFALDITRRKQAEIALAQRETELAASERRFRALTDAMPQIVWSTRPDGYHDYFNQRWYEFTGVPQGSTYGNEWSGLFHPDDLEHTWARWHHALLTGEPYEIEYRLRHRSGEYRWVLGRALPVRNEQGEIERWFGTCTDIHEFKKAQQALAESEEFARRLLSSSNDCIAVLDLEGHLRFMNEGGQRVMEISDFREIEGSHWPSVCSTDQEVQAAIETARAGRTGRFQGLCPTLAGTRKWWDVVVTPMKGPDGQPERLLWVSRDITERKQAEEAEQRLAAIIASSDDAILSMDQSGAIASWNRGAEQLYGYRAEEVIGKSVTILIPEDRQDEETELLERSSRGEHVEHFETVRRRKDGTLVEISLTVSPVRDRQGRIIGASKIARDITERKRMEEQLLLVNRELHHRVKNTLATVQAVISSTARRAQTTAEFQQAVTERISSLAKTHTLLIEKDRCGATIRDLLQSELDPYDDGTGHRVKLEGPDVRLSSEIAVAFGMAVHELTTNAAKYGAFSLPGGCLEVNWSLENIGDLANGCRLTLNWQERGGPPVKKPERQGFGSVLLQRALGRQLGGNVEMTFAQDGLQVRISATLPPH